MKYTTPTTLSLRSPGFTLVELLVVIGIIALLIGILLPTLGRARESANQVKCAANMRSLAQGLIQYAQTNKGWMPGPHTSGRIWPASGDLIDPGETSSGTTPIQNMDWASPIVGSMFKLPDDDVERAKALWSGQLHCPTNDINYNHRYQTSALRPEDFRYASYSAVIQFHTWPQREATTPPAILAAMNGNTAGTPVYKVPDGYAPQIQKVGTASEKVFLVEGARYVNLPQISLNLIRYQIQGGNYMIGGPFFSFGDTPFQFPSGYANWDGETAPVNLNMAWRHRKKMNLAFFDGHVETRDIANSIQVGLYVPKGSSIEDATLTYDPDDSNGRID